VWQVRKRDHTERPDAGLRRFLGVDPAVEETLIRAGIYPRDAHLVKKVKRRLDFFPEKVHTPIEG
jgi:hypothetical protein